MSEAVRRRPYSVVLFDEIEKAHPEVFNVLLQILDDGRLTDGHGRTVDFKNTVIIMTSNVGSQWLQDVSSIDTDEVREKVITALRQQFRPEFINRIDDIIIFNRLGIEEIKQIVELQLAEIVERLKEKRLELVLTENAKEQLAEQGYDAVYGARPLKRTIQRVILDPLAMQMLEGKFTEGSAIEVDFDDGEFVFRKSE